MPPLNQASREFFAAYSASFENYEAAARLAGEFVREVVEVGGVVPHVVDARAKTPRSLLKKLRGKTYPNPATDVTDTVGVRVITYYRDEVDRAVELIRSRITIDASKSADKRQALSLYEFGYRSVHLIARLGDTGPAIPDDLEDVSFEVQVRSVLEHAWAEIEHEAVYKSAVKFSDDRSRTFASVAGTLELMDSLFETFRDAVSAETDDRSAKLAESDGWASNLDGAWLVAVMEELAPDNPGWRAGGGLPAHSTALVLEALKAAGVTTPHAIRLAFETPAYQNARDALAASMGVAPQDISHLALGALLAGSQTGFPKEDFPDLLDDPRVVGALGE